jgi:hypothetical protein
MEELDAKRAKDEKATAEKAAAGKQAGAFSKQRMECRAKLLELPYNLLGERLGKHTKAPTANKAMLAAAAEGSILPGKTDHHQDLDAICGPSPDVIIGDKDAWRAFEPPEVVKLRWVSCTTTVAAKYSGGLALYDYSCRGQAMWLRADGGGLLAATAAEGRDRAGEPEDIMEKGWLETKNQVTRDWAVARTLTALDIKSVKLVGPSKSSYLSGAPPKTPGGVSGRPRT